MTRPEQVVWCDGSQAEYERLIAGMLAEGTMVELNGSAFPPGGLTDSWAIAVPVLLSVR